MLGYRIKQTVFMLAGLFICISTMDDAMDVFVSKHTDRLSLVPVLIKLIWFAVCIAGGELLARKTGGEDDLKRVKPTGLLSD